ncbi:hypothetical protein RAC89_07120 [Paenibacillus sp. GD4]|uniref:hypothetical protein n=1 Tax=Paenibacillus sp. GD4 TaxID=3068890 RepID=UPI002796DB04|nr:hypothetical protein [Paenibacillus sp. GD4]MDQ1910268.1 hypothetical protein [Paenibacillus sp. GD4]
MKIAVVTERPLDRLPCEGAELFPWSELGSLPLESFGAVLLIGSPRIDEPTKLTAPEAARLWRYVEKGGKLYAELIEAFDFPSSRLFGWKQDFPKTRRQLEKLRIVREDDSLERNGLLEWSGAYAAGFPVGNEPWLEFGAYRGTHKAEESAPLSGYPGLSVRRLGAGLVVHSAFALFSSDMKEAFRPYFRWKQVIAAIAAETGIPFTIWPQAIQLTGSNSAAEAVEASIRWFQASGILPALDGTQGVLENVHSVTAALSTDRRPDCHAHTALCFYLYGRWKKDPAWIDASHQLLQYLFDNGYQDLEKDSPSYGFFKWYDNPDRYPDQMFTDDNAWVCFVLLYLYRKTGRPEYLERGLPLAEALLATQGEHCVRPNVLLRGQLKELGREGAAELPPSLNPHFESIAHAAFIQAYLVTGEESYVHKAVQGSRYMADRMEQLNFMYSRTSGLNRFLLPLGYLSRKHDSSGETAAALEHIFQYLLSKQHPMGGIEEADNPDPDRFGKEDAGVYIHNGEGIADQLYTNNFLLMNAWEVWKATGDERFKTFYDRLSGFLCGIQISSADSRYHGGWMRAFDLQHGEYFGNNGDTGWGPYCLESGWTQAIISAGLLLGLLNESLFE